MLYLADYKGVWLSGIANVSAEEKSIGSALSEEEWRERKKWEKLGAWDDIKEECEFQRRVQRKRPVIDVP